MKKKKITKNRLKIENKKIKKAIKHALEVSGLFAREDMSKCEKQHRELAVWLKELLELRKKVKKWNI